MKKFILDLLATDSSLSSMRVMSMVSLAAAIVIAVMGMNKPQVDYSGLCMLVATFLSAAFGGKVAQKSIEMRNNGAVLEAPVDIEIKR